MLQNPQNGLKAELHPQAQWALDEWSVEISMSNDWNNFSTCSRGESIIISEKIEGPLKAPQSLNPTQSFFALFGKNVWCNRSVFTCQVP